MPQQPSSSSSGLPAVHAELGVAVRPASEKFRLWLEERYPNWDLSSAFLQALPTEPVLVSSQDYDLFYLDDEETIRSVASRSPNSDLLPVGCLMSGTMLAIDTRIGTSISIRQIPQMYAMQGECDEIDREHFSLYKVPYVEWLLQNWRFPEDQKYR